jgi:hypothetical protein
MANIKPIYIKLLLVTIVLYVVNLTFLLSDIYYKIGRIEHVLIHSGMPERACMK